MSVDSILTFDMGLSLDGSIAIITGAGGQIGTVLVDAFLAAGCFVGAFDIKFDRLQNSHERLWKIRVDITDETAMRYAWKEVSTKFSSQVPTICVCAAGLDLSFLTPQRGAADMPVDQFRRTLDVNVVGTFLTAKTWLTTIKSFIARDVAKKEALKNVSLILFGSEAGIWGTVSNADYAASKAAIQYGLVKSLAPDSVRVFERARVNAIAPGNVETPMFREECEKDPEMLSRTQATIATGKAVPIEQVARTCLMLASERWSGATTGQIVRVDGGQSGKMFWDIDGSARW